MRTWLKTECRKLFGQRWTRYFGATEEELGEEFDEAELQVVGEDMSEEL